MKQPAQICLLAVFAALVAGCGYPFQFKEQGSLSPPQIDVTKVELATGNGFVRLTRTDDTAGISVAYTRRAGGRLVDDAREHINDVVISSQVEGGVLKLKATWPEGARPYGCDFNVELGIRVPVGIKTSNGLVPVTGTDAPATIWTSNGPVGVTGTSGLTTARSSNGAVMVSVPAATQANFDVATSNAEPQVSGFPTISYSRAERTRKTGALNGGGVNLTLLTSNAPASLNGPALHQPLEDALEPAPSSAETLKEVS